MPRLTASDCALILTKHQANRLGLAVLLAFFSERGRFPRRSTDIDRALVNDISAELRLAGPADFKFSLSGRSVERHRAEIRDLLGFREATVADGEALSERLQHQTGAIGANPDSLHSSLRAGAGRSSSNRQPPIASTGSSVPRSMRMTSGSRRRSRSVLLPKGGQDDLPVPLPEQRGPAP